MVDRAPIRCAIRSTLPPGFILGHSRAIHQGSVDHAVRRRSCCHFAPRLRISKSCPLPSSQQVCEGEQLVFWCSLLGRYQVGSLLLRPSRAGDSTSERDRVAQGAKIYTEKHMQILDCLTSLMLDTTLGLAFKEDVFCSEVGKRGPPPPLVKRCPTICFCFVWLLRFRVIWGHCPLQPCQSPSNLGVFVSVSFSVGHRIRTSSFSVYRKCIKVEPPCQGAQAEHTVS